VGLSAEALATSLNPGSMMPFSSRVYELFQRTAKAFEFRTVGKWFFLSAMIGVAVGLGAIAFHFLAVTIQYYGLGVIAGLEDHEAVGDYVPAFLHMETAEFRPAMMLLVITGGGLLAGLLVYIFAPEAEGPGTDAVVDAFHNKRGVVPPRVPLVKIVASAIVLGTGGSAGREGPIAHIGAGLGSMLATRLGLSDRDRRIMLAAGMGAGVGAIFRAPLAGALFAGEIMYRDADLEADVIVPAAISSTVAYSVFCLSLPMELRFEPLFASDSNMAMTSPLELIPYTFMAIVLVLAGVLYIKTYFNFFAAFRKLPMIPHLRPALGALAAGIVALTLFFLFRQNPNTLAVLGSGYGVLQATLTSVTNIGPGLLVAIALGKMLTTSLTTASGGSAGVFGPSMVIGGCLGSAMGQIFHNLWPSVVHHPEAFAMVAMAGFFAGCARAPFSTILMVSEMTGDYRLLLPTMWVSTICFLLGQHWSLYRKQVATRLESPAHRGDFIVDMLAGMLVADVYSANRKIRKVPENATLDEIVHLLAKTSQRYFPVVDRDDRMVGVFSAEDVRAYLYDDTLWQLANARDVMTTNIASVSPDDDLNEALNHFTALNIDELPVLDPDDSGRLLGVLRRKELIAAYNRKVIAHKQAVESESKRAN